jgi:predicted metal-binding membrane protein
MTVFATSGRAGVVLIGAAVVAWAVTVERMGGMDMGPWTDLGGLGWFLGIWITMMAAMMLPSAAPFVARGLSAGLFAVEYLAVWTAYGLAAYALFRLWDVEGGRYAAAGVIVAAGIYELTPLKARFLRCCRTPGGRGGLAYGLECVGCCFGLMAALFALGVMSLVWMAVVAGAILAEKVLPHGVLLTRGVAVGLVILGIWVGASPSSVPGLTAP